MKIRDGIVLKNICGTWLLIAAGETSEHCKYVREVNDTFAWYWKEIEQGRTKEEIVADTLERFDVSEELVRSDIEEYIRSLYAMNYLIKEETK